MVLVVRGTTSLADALTDLTGHPEPFDGTAASAFLNKGHACSLCIPQRRSCLHLGIKTYKVSTFTVRGIPGPKCKASSPLSRSTVSTQSRSGSNSCSAATLHACCVLYEMWCVQLAPEDARLEMWVMHHTPLAPLNQRIRHAHDMQRKFVRSNCVY